MIKEAKPINEKAMEREHPVESSPQTAYIRHLQQQLVQRYNLSLQDGGKELHKRANFLKKG